VKNKGGDFTDRNNYYRTIALANMETKILETILMDNYTVKMIVINISSVLERDILLICVPVL